MVVACFFDTFAFFNGFFVQCSHVHLVLTVYDIGSVAFWATMPKATIKFVCGIGFFAEPVDLVCFVVYGNSFSPPFRACWMCAPMDILLKLSVLAYSGTIAMVFLGM